MRLHRAARGCSELPAVRDIRHGDSLYSRQSGKSQGLASANRWQGGGTQEPSRTTVGADPESTRLEGLGRAVRPNGATREGSPRETPWVCPSRTPSVV